MQSGVQDDGPLPSIPPTGLALVHSGARHRVNQECRYLPQAWCHSYHPYLGVPFAREFTNSPWTGRRGAAHRRSWRLWHCADCTRQADWTPIYYVNRPLRATVAGRFPPSVHNPGQASSVGLRSLTAGLHLPHIGIDGVDDFVVRVSFAINDNFVDALFGAGDVDRVSLQLAV